MCCFSNARISGLCNRQPAEHINGEQVDQHIDVAALHTLQAEEKIKELKTRFQALAEKCRDASPQTEGLNKELVEELASMKEEVAEIEKQATDEIKAELKVVKEQIERSKKWIDLGFDPSLIATDYESVDFAVKTHLVFSINTYKNSAESLEGPAMDIHNIDGKAHIMIKGELKPLKDMVEILGENRVVYYDNGEFERYDGWTFVHPDGFVEHDKFYWDRLQDAPPVARLNQEAVNAIFDKAGAKEGQDYVLEVVSTKTYNLLPGGLLGKIAKKFVNMWMHTHMMIIKRDGRAWSASTLLEKSEYEQVVKGLATKFGKTGSSKINAPDYVLTRNNCEHFAGYFPMNDEQAEKVFDHANKLNSGDTRAENTGDGFDFNMLSENCTKKMGVEPLQILGHNVEAHESGLDSLLKALPDLEDIPFIGGPLSKFVKAVDAVARPVINFVGKVLSYVPQPIRRVASRISDCLGSAIAYIPRKIAVFALSLLLVKKLGGRENTTGIRNRYQDNAPTLCKNKFTDLFNEERLKVYQGYNLVEWMQKNHPEKVVKFNCRKNALMPLDPRKAEQLQGTVS